MLSTARFAFICLLLLLLFLGGPAWAEDAPASGDARAAWIGKMLRQVAGGAVDVRNAALEALVTADHDGDCTNPLIAMLPENEKKPARLTALIRALGRDGLVAAAVPISASLAHKDASIRANAAVSLEYIGSSDKAVIAALRKAVGRQKDDAVANHMYRALGRCGSKDAKTRALLLKKASSSKSEFASYGPCIGLGYFEDDAKAARGVEKLLKQIGVPGGKRGGGTNVVKRGLVSWTVAAIGEEKSAKFMREELMARMEHVKAPWVAGLLGFWDLVARKCDGEEAVMPAIEQGVRGFVAYAKTHDLARYGAEIRNLMDEARTKRDNTAFTPKGDRLLDDGGDM